MSSNPISTLEDLARFLTDLGPDWYLATDGSGLGGFHLWHLPMTPGIDKAYRQCKQVVSSGSLASCINYAHRILGDEDE